MTKINKRQIKADLKVLKECVEAAAKPLNFDANLYEVYHLEEDGYPKRAYDRRQRMFDALARITSLVEATYD